MPHDKKVDQATIPRLDVVRISKRLLDQAQNNEIQGLAYVGYFADGRIVYNCVGEAINQPDLTAEILQGAVSDLLK